MRIRPFLKNLLLFFSTCAIFLVLLEITLRTTNLFGARLSYSKPDSILAYRFVPNREYYYHKENTKPITGTFNNFGWRDRDWKVEKPTDAIRIAIIGDSFVEAFQVELDSTFLRITEREMNANNSKKVELMNFGRSGFTQTDQLWVLQHDVARFSPDIVIITVLPTNDFEDVRRETAPDDERPFYLLGNDGQLTLDVSFNQTQQFKTKSRIDPFKRHSALLSLLAERYTTYKLERDIARQTELVAQRTEMIAGYLSLCTTHAEYVNSYRFSRFLIEKIAAQCRGSQTKMLLVCLDTEAHIPERERELATIDSTFNADFFDDDLKELSSSLQINYLGLQKPFRDAHGADNRPLHWQVGKSNGHWNYDGHRVAARELTRTLNSIINSDSTAQSN